MTKDTIKAIQRGAHVGSTLEDAMHPLLKRHEIQVLLKAGHTQAEVATFCSVGERTVRRIGNEPPVEHVEDLAEPSRRRIGRPSKTAPFRAFVQQTLEANPEIMSLEVFRLAKQKGYSGGTSAMYELVAELRPRDTALQMRFEGLPGEFSQHDFGQVDVTFVDGSRKRIHFFASRLKYSRWAEVTVVPNQTAETLIRTLADHFVAFGGMPLLAVFDRPRTVALKWNRKGEVTEWNPVFAYAALELGFGAEVCWPYQPRQKGSVEQIVKWVKNSFFKQRRFADEQDMRKQLCEWLVEANEKRPSRATKVIPAVRRDEELPRFRPLKVQPEDLALRIPVHVGPTAVVVHETHSYSMPPEAANCPATLYLYRDKVKIVAGRHEAEHKRLVEPGKPSTLPEHRAARLAVIRGKRGKRYLERQHLLETGEAAQHFLTHLVHRDPGAWIRDVNQLHDLLQRHGADAMNLAFRAAVEAGTFSVSYVATSLGHHPRSKPRPLPLYDREVTP